jgi:hypothetical protein
LGAGPALVAVVKSLNLLGRRTCFGRWSSSREREKKDKTVKKMKKPFTLGFRLFFNLLQINLL